jgi:integrase
MLSDRHIKNAKPGLLADGEGLYLRVLASGKKTWMLRTRVAGKDVWKAFGAYPDISLANARTQAADLKSGAVVANVSAATAISTYLKKLAVRRPEQVEWLLSPLSCSKNVDSYTRQELVSILQEKANTSPVVANRMLTRWKDFFTFCGQQGWVEQNPLDPVQRRFVGGKETSRNRVLSWDEIVDMLRLPLTFETHRALYFVLATGLRPSEALHVLSTKQLTNIPTKTTPRKLASVPHVRAVLQLRATTPSSHLTLSNALRRKGVTFTPHDLRRTFATRLSDLGVAPHIIEKLLHHKFEGVMAIYNHAEYWDEQVAAMKLWGRKLSALRREARQKNPGT